MPLHSFDKVKLSRYENIEEKILVYRRKLANELEEMVADAILTKGMTLEQVIETLRQPNEKSK